MKLSQIKELLKAETLGENEKDPEVTFCMASDMMSDVLAYAEAGALLVTGLISAQSVRTADVADASGIIYVRGKKPDEQTIELANELSVPLLSTEFGMFETCGILESNGLKGVC